VRLIQIWGIGWYAQSDAMGDDFCCDVLAGRR
jgi:hypothetical protein